MSFFVRLFLVVSLLVIPIFSTLHAQTAQDYYKQGIELKKQNRIDEAIKAFQKAVEKDRKFAEAYYELALLYQSKKTPASRKLAEDALLAAKKHGSNDLKYLTALALLYEEMNMFPVAKTTWERVLKLEPENIDALAGMARYHVHESQNYKNRVDYNLDQFKNLIPEKEWKFREKNPLDIYYIPEMKLLRDDVVEYCIFHPMLWDKNMLEYLKNSLGVVITYADLHNFIEIVGPGEIKFHEFVAFEDSNVIKYNKKILSLDPENRDALFRLGIVYFDNNNLNEFSMLFKELVEKYPDDKDGHLFLGLANHRLHDYDKAFEHYEIAKSLMTYEEHSVFANVGYLKIGGLQETELRTADNDSEFWVQRDPLYLTTYNERQLEHYSRVAEANLRFSVPSKGIDGWQSDRGKIFIKYGNPEKKKNLNAGDTRKLLKKEYYDFLKRYLRTDFETEYLKRDFWYFDDFTFMFETSTFDKKNDYKLGIMTGLNYEEIATEVEKEYPELYKYEPKGLFIDFPFDVATFRGEEGRTRMEVYYGVPFNKVLFEEEGEYYYGNYEVGIFFHDQNWKRVLEDVQYKDLQFEVTAIDTSSDDFTVDQLVNQVEPDSYYLAVEMRDMYSDNVGTYRDTVNVEKYGYETLQISDIQLAMNIKLRDSTGAVTRDNLNIIPNPPRFYRANQPIYIYYEIYNLFLDGFPGNTDYTVEYNIEYIGEDKYSIVDYVRRLILNEKQELGVTTKFTRSGRERDESSFLRIDHSLTKPGPYRLTLKVIDNIAHKTVEKSVVLRLFEEK